MMNLHELGLLAWTQFCQITVLSGLVLLLHRTFLKSRPQIAGVLWLVVLAKCVTPPVFASPTGIFSWAQVRVQPISYTGQTELGGGDMFAATGGTIVDWLTHPTVVVVLGALWGAGAITLLTAWLRRWRELQREIGMSECRPEIQAVADRLSAEIGMKRPVEILVSTKNLGPAVVGVFRPQIVLPVSLVDQLSIAKIEPLVVHELTHVKRYDTLLGALQMMAATIWWFHPLVWLSIRRSNLNVEQCVDQTVVTNYKYSPRAYVGGMLAVLEARCRLNPLAGVPGVRSHEITRHRIQQILASKHRSAVSPRLLAAAAIAFALLVLPGQSLQLSTGFFVNTRDYSTVVNECTVPSTDPISHAALYE